MRRVRGAVVGLALLWSGAVAAHAHLKDSTPADGSKLAAAPGVLVLEFSEPAQLTALSITHAGASAHKLSAPAAAAAQVRIALPALTPGEYLVTWRALSADGHLAPGQIHFTVTQ
jgi:methionine-rich copper-binding protein CopC